MARISWAKFFGDDALSWLDRFWLSLNTQSGGVHDAAANFLRLQFDAGFALPIRPANPAAPGAAPDSKVWVVVPDASEIQVPQGDASTADSVAAPVPVPDLFGIDAARIATLTIGATQIANMEAIAQVGHRDDAAYIIQYDDDLQSGLVIDAANRTLMPGGPGNWPDLGLGHDDTLILSGDFSGGATLPAAPLGLETVIVSGASDYVLASTDLGVAAGATLTIDAMGLGAGHHIAFDGSAETDGRFAFLGSGSGDVFIGGAGDDRLYGADGGDRLTGGGGADTFFYVAAHESSGPDYDTLTDFDPASDKIDLPGTVTGFAAPVDHGALSLGSFNADLATALGALGAGQAAWFAPDGGDLAGKIFLVVDANGKPGYQAGEDYVIAVEGHPLADLIGHPAIFV
jgi:Ca2+-binding RTX toxin-like protein